MSKFSPCLWFDTQALQAAEFYVSLFKNSKVDAVSYYSEGAPLPAGTVLTANFTLAGQEFSALNGGPVFTITPAISFWVGCETEAECDALWGKLLEGGQALMPLGSYPFSKKFGWVQDKFGVTWQLDVGKQPQKITPKLLFTGKQHGRAAEAMQYYCSIFANSKVESSESYGANEDDQGIKHALFSLAGEYFMAMDSGYPHPFTFTEGLSFYAFCKDQAEIDAVWGKLTAGGEEQPCGWLKDKFGVSWQIVNDSMETLMDGSDPERAQRVMQALFQMKKIDIQKLQDAYDNK